MIRRVSGIGKEKKLLIIFLSTFEPYTLYPKPESPESDPYTLDPKP